jgi:hypothetical protein
MECPCSVTPKTKGNCPQTLSTCVDETGFHGNKLKSVHICSNKCSTILKKISMGAIISTGFHVAAVCGSCKGILKYTGHYNTDVAGGLCHFCSTPIPKLNKADIDFYDKMVLRSAEVARNVFMNYRKCEAPSFTVEIA